MALSLEVCIISWDEWLDRTHVLAACKPVSGSVAGAAAVATPVYEVTIVGVICISAEAVRIGLQSALATPE